MSPAPDFLAGLPLDEAPAGPVPFLAFCARLGVALRPGQETIARVVFDGAEPDGHEAFGGVPTFPADCRRTVVLDCGGRAGKSYVFVGLRALWGALTRDLTMLAPGEVASALIIAPDLRLARQSLRYARGAAESDPDIEALVADDGDNVDGFLIQRPDGIVRVEVLPATAGGSAVRARNLTDVFLDECAFFRDRAAVVNDMALFQATRPRVMPGGQAILASTPWGQAGLLWDLWKKNYGHPVDAMAVHAPTVFLRPEMADAVELERRLDADNATREFDAEFMGAGGSTFFDGQLLEACIDKAMVLPEAAEAGDMVTAGGDFAFEADSSALCIAHLRKGCVRIGELIELKPDAGAPLKPSVTVAAFADAIRWHGGSFLMCDAHYRQTVCEILADKGLGFVEAPTVPAEAYVRTRTLMREGKVKIPDHPRLLAQLREVIARSRPGGGISILLPRHARRPSGDPGRSGGHGDLVSAFVLAVYQAAGQVVRADAPAPGTREADQVEEARRQEQRRREGVTAELAKAGGGWWQQGSQRGAADSRWGRGR